MVCAVDCHKGGFTGTPGPPGYAPVRLDCELSFPRLITSRSDKVLTVKAPSHKSLLTLGKLPLWNRLIKSYLRV